MKIYRFRNCLLNTAERSVIKDCRYLQLTTKTLDVLQFLIERAGQVVTKDEILGKVWDGSFVEESNLPVHISKLRRTLGETISERYIETVQGIGYRFVAPLENVDKQAWEEVCIASNANRSKIRPDDLRLESVAVLPFKLEKGSRELPYVADGLTEALISTLSVIPGLKVISRNTMLRYRSVHADAKDIGEILGVDAVLVGSVSADADKMVVSAELIRAGDETHLWGGCFQGGPEDFLTIQEQLLSGLMTKLRLTVCQSTTRANYPGTRNSLSHKAYLKGKYLFEKRTAGDVSRAIDCFNESIRHDASNIYPYVGAIDCYRFLYVIDALPHEMVSLKLDPLLSAASQLNQSVDVLELVLAELKLQFDWNLQAAASHARAAINLNPNCVPAYHRYAEILMIANRRHEALAQIGQVLQIDPFSLLTSKRLGRLHYGLGYFETAMDYLREAYELEPCDYETLALMGSVLAELGAYEEALIAFRASMASHPTAEVLSMMGYAWALQGKRRQAREVINRLRPKTQSEKEYPLKLARIYLALGDADTTYDLLERAFDLHEVDLAAVTYDPRLKEIQSDPRFTRLVERVWTLKGEVWSQSPFYTAMVKSCSVDSAGRIA
jgi:DNA-binding winged helix-turn-helix (wHTH) protein/tetratricopeptide (TPR) repeat protein